MNSITSDPETFDLEMMTPKTTKNQRCFYDDDSGICLDDEDYAAVFGGELSPLPSSGLDLCDDDQFQLRRPRAWRDLLSGQRTLDSDECDDYSAPTRILRQRSSSFSVGDTNPVREAPSADIKMAVDMMAGMDDLVADGSRPYCLPTVKGKHQDMKSISPQTMCDILSGRFDDVIDTCRIIDCRYPYEYEGGHIQGGENLYTQEAVSELLRSGCQHGKTHILIFHCEFSSERGPKMCRYLRAQDRAVNKESYPSLNFPEVYILDGGYKAFFEHNKEYCSPMTYMPMLHKSHMEDLRHFRSRSKSWAAGEKRKGALRLRF